MLLFHSKLEESNLFLIPLTFFLKRTGKDDVSGEMDSQDIDPYQEFMKFESKGMEESRVKAQFEVGDRVKVIKGDLKNVLARVAAVDAVKAVVAIIPLNLPHLKGQKMEVQANILANDVRIGDHVKILDGRKYSSSFYPNFRRYVILIIIFTI